MAMCSPVFGKESDSLQQANAYTDGGIPLPRQLSYTSKGIGIGMALGMTHPLGGEDKWLIAWNLLLEYFYTPRISGGGEVWIYGGEVDSKTLIIYRRYRLHARYHFPLFSRIDFFVAPLLWFENTDLTKLREEANADTVQNSYIYEDAPEQNGFAVGAEAGFGVKLPYHFGFTSEIVFEQSFSENPLLAWTFGLAYDLRSQVHFLQKNFYATWVSFEVTNRKYLSEKWDKIGCYFLLGLHVNL